MAEGRQRAYEVVTGWVEQRILDGQLSVGDQLPAERELAVRLGVSRAVVREGVRALQAQGILHSTVGAGGAGGTRITAVPSGALAQLLRLHVALTQFPLGDVLEVRVALERLSARLAAGGLAPEGLTALDAALDRMREAAASREEFNEGDTAFHVAIAEAAGNRLAADTTVAIRESVRAPLMRLFAALSEERYRSLVQELHQEHEAIRDALVAGAADRAEELVEAHIRTAWARLGGGGEAAAPEPVTMEA